MKVDELLNFIDKAGRKTYAGNGVKEKTPERQGFTEMVYQEGDYFYRDSWTGYLRSRGMELVRHKGKPIWSCLYGGGMVKDCEKMADECFEFLKCAMNAKDKKSPSVRGPESFSDGLWNYLYSQEGDKTEFQGHEEIYYKSQLVFFHRTIGGIIQHNLELSHES